MHSLVTVAAVAALMLVAGFASVAESSLVRIGRARAHQLLEQKRGGAARLLRITEDPAPFLNVVLLVMVLAHVTGTVLMADFAVRRFDQLGMVIAVVVMTFLVFVFVEIVPKTLTLHHPEGCALLVSRPVYLLGKVLSPLGRVLVFMANAPMAVLPGRALPRGPFSTSDEIRHLVDAAENEEEIEDDERELIHSIFEFGDTVVREVMVPRTDMIAIRHEATLSEALETIIKAGYSRIPAYEGDTDNIIGILYAKDLLKSTTEPQNTKISVLLRKPVFVPEQKKVADLLREMQQQRIHMAIVVDEYGGTAGLVTIEDLIEEIVGEIVDEYDHEEALVEPLAGDALRVSARLPIDEVNELLGAELPDEEWDTVGGLVFGLTGRVPAPGESVRYDSLEFTTERVSGRRIQKVVIKKVTSETGAGA